MTQFHVDEAVMKSLSKNELSVLQYIYAHPQRVCSMSIKELSSQVCYSPTTVLRLCKKLNLSGFAELKYTLKSRLNHPAPTFSASKGESRDDTEILENISKELAATFHFIDHEQLLEIVTLLDSHKPLYIYSPSGITGIVAEYLQRLLFIAGRKQVFMMESPKLAQHMVKELSPDNILFLISTGGVFPPTLALARIAAMRQIPVIAISPYEVNTLSTLAQYNLRFFTIQRENSGAELTSRLPLFYLISALIRCYVFYKDGIRL